MLILADERFTNHSGRRARGGFFLSAIAASEDSWQYGLTDLHAPPASLGRARTASSEAQPEYQDAEWQSKRQR